MKQFGYSKNEKLKSEKEIKELFEKGINLFSFPIKVSFLIIEINNKSVCKTMFIASKKRYPKAYQRNRIKRILREAFRLSKTDFYSNLNNYNCSIHLSISFVGKNEIILPEIQKNLNLILSKIIKHIHDNKS